MIRIDTPTANRPEIYNHIPGWFLDQFPEATPPERLAHDYAYHLIWEMKRPKKIETVRKRILDHWGFLRLLADQDGAIFDEVFTAFVERVLD